MVDYYKERLDQDYIPKYHKTFETLRDKFRNSSDISWEEVEAAQFNCEREDKVTMDNFLDSMGLASQELRDLSTLCKGGYNPELRCLIASKAFEMRHSRPVKAYIQVCFGEADSRQFLSCIYFLGRIRAAYETFVACAKANPSFQSIQAYLVLSPEIPKPNPESAPTLAQTMELAGLDCSSFVIRNHISATMQWRALEDKFRNRQQDALANLRVHCETQILQTIQQDTEDLSDVFPYFGCSKRSCYLCTLVFEEYGFTTRGTHGKIYERWMVLGESSTTDYALPRPRLVSIMKAIQTKIIEILQTPLCPTKPPIAEYSAGYTVESTMDHPRDDRIENQRSLELFKTTYISTEAGKLEQLFRKLNGYV